MSTPLDDFKAYLEQYDTADYSFALGRWTETTNTANNRYIVLRQYAARRPILSMRFIGIQVLIVGRRDEQQGVSYVSQFANGLHDFVQQRKTGCSVVAVNTITDVVGPSYTEENRPVFELNLEMMYQS